MFSPELKKGSLELIVLTLLGERKRVPVSGHLRHLIVARM